MKVVELRPIKDPIAYWEAIEKRIIEAFVKIVYAPIFKALSSDRRLLNAQASALANALKTGRLTYSDGVFRGKFRAETSSELKALGAVWDKKTGTFSLPWHKMDAETRQLVRESGEYFTHVAGNISRRLARILPQDISEAMPVRDLFEASLWQVERDFQKSVKNITVAPRLTKEQAEQLAKDWTNNMDLSIKGWADGHIKELRATVEKSVLSGDRFETLIKGIRTSYGVTERKAKFLARQETHLMLAKFQETRYVAAGVNEYRWGCVKMPHDPTPMDRTPGNVRYYHGILEGKTFRWGDPPITAKNPERRNNPGQDYNCRCFPRPLVRF